MNTQHIRNKSLQQLKRMGLLDASVLPLLSVTEIQRSSSEIADRLLTLYAVVACAYGFKHPVEWLEQERLDQDLSKAERAFLRRTQGDVSSFQKQVEALWALAWALGYVSIIDWSRPCEDDFIKSLPDLKRMEPSAAFRSRARLRSNEELLQNTDLAYCLHWVLVEMARLRRPYPLKVAPHVIVQRRHALEWILGQEDWDEVSLDT